MSYYLRVVIKLQTKGVIYTFPVLGSPLLFVLPLGRGGLTIETWNVLRMLMKRRKLIMIQIVE